MSSVRSPSIDEKPDEIEIDTGVESESSGDNVTRREVWNKPANDSAAVAAAGIVIGGEADLWPSLSEGVNTRIKPTYKAVPESSASLTSHVSSSKNIAGHSSLRTNSSHNGTRSGNSRQPKGNATRSSSGNGERSHQQHHRPSSQGPVSDVSSSNCSQNSNTQLETGQSNGPRSQLHGGSNHPQHRDSNRRANGGPPRGDGSHGRRRNVDRDSNSHPPNFNGRNGPVLPPVFPGPFPVPIPRPALAVAPYPPPPPPLFPPTPFIAPGIYPFAGRPFLYGPPLGPVTMRPHPHFVPMGPPIVIVELCNQIDYYFSEDNLVRDVHLRRNMDDQGWVMVNTIAEFKKVKEIIGKVEQFLADKDIDPLLYILNAVLNSYTVEVQGNKLRKRVGWQKYVLRNIVESSSTAGESPANTELAVRLENTMIEEEPNNTDSITEIEESTTDNQVGQQPSKIETIL